MSEEKPKVGDIIGILDEDENLIARLVITGFKKDGSALTRPCEEGEFPKERSITE